MLFSLLKFVDEAWKMALKNRATKKEKKHTSLLSAGSETRSLQDNLCLNCDKGMSYVNAL